MSCHRTPMYMQVPSAAPMRKALVLCANCRLWHPCRDRADDHAKDAQNSKKIKWHKHKLLARRAEFLDPR